MLKWVHGKRRYELYVEMQSKDAIKKIQLPREYCQISGDYQNDICRFSTRNTAVSA